MTRPRWIAVDLDGTLARWDGFVSLTHIGEPIVPMLERVKAWLTEGRDVRIFTARVAYSIYRPRPQDVFATVVAIEEWCLQHIGLVLPVTCIKDADMEVLWDDRAVQVLHNTGQPVKFGAVVSQAVRDNPEPLQPGEQRCIGNGVDVATYSNFLGRTDCTHLVLSIMNMSRIYLSREAALNLAALIRVHFPEPEMTDPRMA
jgi:hypothetical protein